MISRIVFGSFAIVVGIFVFFFFKLFFFFFFFQAEDGIRDHCVTGVQTCALPIYMVDPNSKATFQRIRTLYELHHDNDPEL